MPLKSRLKSSVAGQRASESPGRIEAVPPKALPKTLSIPEAGYLYFGLSKNGAYDAAERGEIPYITIGRLKRVPVALMEKMMLEGTSVATPPPPIETPVKRAKATLAKPSKYPRSTAVHRRDPVLEPLDTS
jgi:hypothetical protein